ncbi:hypothetical protein KI387_015626, partial [Taxus chinensis]
ARQQLTMRDRMPPLLSRMRPTYLRALGPSCARWGSAGSQRYRAIDRDQA